MRYPNLPIAPSPVTRYHGDGTCTDETVTSTDFMFDEMSLDAALWIPEETVDAIEEAYPPPTLSISQVRDAYHDGEVLAIDVSWERVPPGSWLSLGMNARFPCTSHGTNLDHMYVDTGAGAIAWQTTLREDPTPHVGAHPQMGGANGFNWLRFRDTGLLVPGNRYDVVVSMIMPMSPPWQLRPFTVQTTRPFAFNARS